MIPTNRPVIGKDLDSIRQQHGLLAQDACWIFGISPNKWSSLVRQSPDQPVPDPTLALLVRFLDEHPDMAVIPRWPDPQEVMQLMNAGAEKRLTTTEFSLLLGYEGTAAGRWLRSGGRITAGASHLMLFMKVVLDSMTPEERDKWVRRWRQIVTAEAEARGESDLFKVERWPSTVAANDDSSGSDSSES